MEDIFEKNFLNEIGYKVIKDDGQYGKAHEIATNGMTVLEWNREGHGCTYFGTKLEPNASFSIRKDGNTRTAFNGYVFNQEQVRLLIQLTL